MSSTDCWPDRVVTPVPMDEDYEHLRRMFYTRLCSERSRLLSLGGARCQQAEPLPLLDDIRGLAHSICGVAAKFQARDVCAAAGTLESAAQRAARGPTAQRNALVTEALEALVDVLATNQMRPRAY
jgi:hypothetical protein